MENFRELPFYKLIDIIEEKYYPGVYIRELAQEYPDDELVRYFNDRVTSFAAWGNRNVLYENLDEIAQAIFITLTDEYGEGWTLHKLLKEHPEDELVHRYNSYLGYLDRVWDLNACLESDGFDLREL